MSEKWQWRITGFTYGALIVVAGWTVIDTLGRFLP